MSNFSETNGTEYPFLGSEKSNKKHTLVGHKNNSLLIYYPFVATQKQKKTENAAVTEFAVGAAGEEEDEGHRGQQVGCTATARRQKPE